MSGAQADRRGSNGRRLLRGAGLGALAAGAAGLQAAWSADVADEALEAVSRDRIVVTGARTPIEREKVASSLTVVTGAELEGVQYVSDALRRVPGVAVSRTGSFGGATAIRIRGAEANHVLVLLDGVEAASAESGEVDFSSLLAADIDRIEVLRGPQSGLYGSNALAGVVNIITKRGGDGLSLRASAEAGSFDTRQAQLSGALGDGRSYISGAFARRVTGGFNTSQNGDEKDGDENTTLYLRAGSELSDTLRFDVSARHVDKSSDTDGFDFSGGPSQGLSIDDESYSDTVDWDVGGSAELDLADGDWSTTLSGSYASTELNGGEVVQTYGGETSRLKIALQSSLTFGGPGAESTLTGFAEHERETYRNTVPYDPSQAPEQERALDGLGVEYRLALSDQLYLSAAARKDFNDDFEDAKTFSLGASWVLGDTGTRLHASYGAGVTNPTFTEQFGYIPDQFVGNLDLTPEKARGFDVGVEQALFGGTALFDLTYFQSALENEIVSAYPSVVNDTGESERQGVEASLAADIAGFSLTGAYTYTNAQDPDGTDEIRRPEHAASFDVRRRFGNDRASLGAGLVYNGQSLDTDYRNYYVNGFVAEKSVVDAYTLLRVSGDYQLTDRVQLYVHIENVLDEDYQELIGYATPGRAAFAGVRVALDRPRRLGPRRPVAGGFDGRRPPDPAK